MGKERVSGLTLASAKAKGPGQVRGLSKDRFSGMAEEKPQTLEDAA